MTRCARGRGRPESDDGVDAAERSA